MDTIGQDSSSSKERKIDHLDELLNSRVEVAAAVLVHEQLGLVHAKDPPNPALETSNVIAECKPPSDEI